MDFSLEARTAHLSVGEFSDFTLGPRDSSGGPQGIWRAQLGTYWHQQLRAQATAEHGSAAEFEVSIEGRIFHRGWTLTFNGRIDQLLRLAPKPLPGKFLPAGNAALRPVPPSPSTIVLREIKTVTRPLPADASELRRDYPGYFTQLATYVALARLGTLGPAVSTFSSQLIFVETASGLAQPSPSLLPTNISFASNSSASPSFSTSDSAPANASVTSPTDRPSPPRALVKRPRPPN